MADMVGPGHGIEDRLGDVLGFQLAHAAGAHVERRLHRRIADVVAKFGRRQGPGEMIVVRILSLNTSRRSESVKARTPHFVAA